MDHNTENTIIEIVRRPKGRAKRETPLTDEDKNREQGKWLKDMMNKIMNTEICKKCHYERNKHLKQTHIEN